MRSPFFRLTVVALPLLLLACGEDEPDDSDTQPEVTVAAPSGSPGAPGADGAPAADAVIECLEDAGLDASDDDGPPPRIDVAGSGNGAVFYYADLTTASEAVAQLTEELTGSGELLTAAAGSLALYYVGSSDEAFDVQECVAH